MDKKRNLRLQSNWMLYGKSLLSVESITPEDIPTPHIPITPDEFGEIIADNEEKIRAGMQEMYEKNKKNNPNGRILHPWLHTVKVATYADTFTHGLTAESEPLEPQMNVNTNDSYLREHIRDMHHPYLDVVDETAFAWRMPGRMSGYSVARDGLWLQIKHRQHVMEDTLIAIP